LENDAFMYDELSIYWFVCVRSIVLYSIVIETHKGHQIVPGSSKIPRDAVIEPRGFLYARKFLHIQQPSVQVWIVSHHGNV